MYFFQPYLLTLNLPNYHFLMLQTFILFLLKPNSLTFPSLNYKVIFNIRSLLINNLLPKLNRNLPIIYYYPFFLFIISKYRLKNIYFICTSVKNPSYTKIICAIIAFFFIIISFSSKYYNFAINFTLSL